MSENHATLFEDSLNLSLTKPVKTGRSNNCLINIEKKHFHQSSFNMLDSVQIAVLSTLACFALLFVAYVKSVLGKAAKEQLQKEAGSSLVDGNDDDNSNKAAAKARKVRMDLRRVREVTLKM